MFQLLVLVARVVRGYNVDLHLKNREVSCRDISDRVVISAHHCFALSSFFPHLPTHTRMLMLPLL